MKRRELFIGGLAGALGSMTGCKHRHTTVPDVDPDVGKKNHPETVAVSVAVSPGKADEVRARLEDHVFEVAAPGVHYARMLLLPDNQLLLTAVFDDDREAFLQLMARNAERTDRVLSLTVGYPPEGAANSEVFGQWVTDNARPNLMLYSAFSDGSEPAMREATVLRSEFLHLVRDVQRDPSSVEAAYTKFIANNRKRLDTHEENAVDQLTPVQLTSPRRQNPFTMVFDVRPDQVKRTMDTLKIGQWAIDNFHIHPLKQIPTVHYARFYEITRTKLLFCSVYDGEWEQYVTDFAVHIPNKLDKVWGGAVGYPKGGAADAPALQKFLEERRIERDYFYSAQSDATVKALQSSLRLGGKLVGFSKRAPTDGPALVRHIDRFVREHQAWLA